MSLGTSVPKQLCTGGGLNGNLIKCRNFFFNLFDRSHRIVDILRTTSYEEIYNYLLAPKDITSEIDPSDFKGVDDNSKVPVIAEQEDENLPVTDTLQVTNDISLLQTPSDTTEGYDETYNEEPSYDDLGPLQICEETENTAESLDNKIEGQINSHDNGILECQHVKLESEHLDNLHTPELILDNEYDQAQTLLCEQTHELVQNDEPEAERYTDNTINLPDNSRQTHSIAEQQIDQNIEISEVPVSPVVIAPIKRKYRN